MWYYPDMETFEARLSEEEIEALVRIYPNGEFTIPRLPIDSFPNGARIAFLVDRRTRLPDGTYTDITGGSRATVKKVELSNQNIAYRAIRLELENGRVIMVSPQDRLAVNYIQ